MNKHLRNILILALGMTATACKGDDLTAREDTLVFNVENEAVRYVMANSDARFCDTPSCIPQTYFDNAELPFRPDQPNALRIEFTDKRAKRATVSVTLNRALGEVVFRDTVNVADGRGAFCVTNLVPGVTYWYTVLADNGRVIERKPFTATGQVRMIALDGGFNIRDLGGWRGLGGRTVKYGLLYRGGSLGGTDMSGNRSDIPQTGKDELLHLGIRAQLDLRAATNCGKYTGEGSLHSYSAGEAPHLSLDFNNTMTDYGAYDQDKSVVADVAWIIYELRHGKPVYFNCRQGADRTGTIAFLLEGLLGCYEYGNSAGGNQMAMDYELTGFSRANLVDNWKVTTSCRPASEAYTNQNKLFRKILDLEAAEPDILLTTVQQKCYYYLNRYVGPDWKGAPLHIDSNDLDWFITHALTDITAADYAPLRPVWAAAGNDLKQVAEQCANVVRYGSTVPTTNN